jgi:hypothetical protein
MSRRLLHVFAALTLVSAGVSTAGPGSSRGLRLPPEMRPSLHASTSHDIRLPVTFIENRGQWRAPIRFAAQAGPLAAGFAPDGIHLRQRGAPSGLRLRFEGASPRARMVGVGRGQGRRSFFVGRDSARWRANVPGYERIRYRGLYPGVDLVARAEVGRLEYDLLLAPGADLERAAFRADGASGIEIGPDGALVLQTPCGALRQSAPRTWEVLPGGRKRPIVCRFRILDAQRRRFGFSAPGRDAKRPLVIDPGLEWATYLGGNDREEITGIALARDGSGDIIIAGKTWSPDFPGTTGGIGEDPMRPFVARLNSTGTGLIYATVFGSPSGWTEHLNGLALDASSAPIVTGSVRTTDFPVTAGAYDTTLTRQGDDDAFVVRFDATGSRMVFSTFLGGDRERDPASTYYDLGGYDEGWSVAVDATDSVIVGGRTTSPDFPTTSGAYDRVLDRLVVGTLDTGRVFAIDDLFVARLNPTGSQLTYSTYLGGQVSEIMGGMVVDGSGFVTLCGMVAPLYDVDASGNARPLGTPYPTTADALQRTHDGNYATHRDAILSRLKLDGGGAADLKYSTIIGGWNSEAATGIALHPGNLELVTITGHTYSWNFRTTPGALRRVPISPDDWRMAFVSRFRFPATGGGSLQWSTLLGGPGHQTGDSVAVESTGEAIVVGWSGMDFPTTERSYQRAGVSLDAFAARIAADGRQILYASLLGGSGDEWDMKALVTAPGTAIIAGRTLSPDFPTTLGAMDRILNADGTTTHPFNSSHRSDGFVARMNLEPNENGDTTAAAPSLIAPANGAVFPAPTPEQLVEVTFDWSDVADPSGVRLYQIEVSPDPDFYLNRLNVAEWTILEPKVSNATVTFAHFFGHQGRYFWRVRTLDGNNTWSPWSTSRTFDLGSSSIPRLSHAHLAQPSVTGGGTVQGTVVIQDRPAPAGGFRLFLTSSNTAVATVPSSVLVPEGSFRANFTITTSTVPASVPVRISVSDDGLPDSPVLWVDPGTPPAPAVSALSLSPTSVTGGSSSTGTVTLTAAAPTGGLVVSLTSSNTALATVPASLTVPAGATSATFNVATASVSATAAATITATGGGASRSASLTVTAPSGPSLSTLSLNPTTVASGGTSTGTVTLTGAAPSGGAVVSLSSSNTSAATVPTSVTIAAGATAATFTVTARTLSTTTSATISAVYAGVTRTASLSVTAATADTVAIQRAEYESSKRILRVEATSTNSSATLKVYVTSTNALIGTLRNEGGGRYRGEFSWSSNPGSITVKSDRGGSATKSVTLK